MTFKGYMNDPRLAVATEVFNSNAKSPEEMANAIARAQEMGCVYRRIASRHSKRISALHKSETELACYESELPVMMQFKSSYIAALIADFIKENSEEKFDAIKREIEASGNLFDIGVVSEWKKGDGERMYGVPFCAFFAVNAINRYYTFSNFDLDKDITNLKGYIASSKRDVRTAKRNLAKYEKQFAKRGILLSDEVI